MNSKIQDPPLYLVTGLSGAGRSTCLHVLEDLGFEGVDNLPLSLLPAMVKEALKPRMVAGPIAIGLDIRNKDFDAEKLVSQIENLEQEIDREIRLIYMDSDDASLISRYNQTRRPHPLTQNNSVSEGVALERKLLSPLKEAADLVVDSTGLTVWQFRSHLKKMLGDGVSDRMSVTIMSFSFAKEVPRDADLVFDARFLRNPHYVDELRALTGKNKAVADYIKKDPDWNTYLEQVKSMLELTLPRYQEEGKSHLTVAIGCTGGRHRSVLLTEELGKWFESQWPLHIVHARLDEKT